MHSLEHDFAVAHTFETHPGVVVVRGVRRSDGLPVILKRPAAQVPSEAEIGRLKYEYEILTSLQQAIPSLDVIKPVQLWGHDDSTVLVLHDIGGTSVATLSEAGPLPLEKVLEIALHTLRALDRVHSAGVLHKDVNPRNIIYAEATGAVQLIDFGIAARVQQEVCAAAQLAVEGTLYYAPPEQMGRVSRHADHRTDYYSLGATLYELLCGEQPFVYADSVQLMHAILTQRPVAPHTRNSRVSGFLSAVVMKLLEKPQEARYQSARGIRHDLMLAARPGAAAPPGPPYELGSEDTREVFTLPTRLLGRDAELEMLRGAYAWATRGQRAVVFVGGPSGVGKSALVAGLHAAMLGNDALFISGKCDQLRRHVPFSALAQALSSALRGMLLESPKRVELWRRRVRGAVGNSGQALIDLIPAVEWLIGPQKPLAPVPARESDNRLHHLLQQLLSAMTEEHPLVLFLDDLQWADAGTVRFLHNLAEAEQKTAGICVVAAYRSDEIAPEHPFAQLCKQLPAAFEGCTLLQLAPLSRASTGQLVAAATATSEADCAELAALVHEKTAGNPFFARAYLTHLHEQGLLTFETGRGAWTWDLPSIRATSVTDNVVGLLTQKLMGMHPEVAHILSLGACLGDKFELDALTAAVNLPRPRVVQATAEGVAQGLLIANGEEHRYAAYTQVNVVYKFAHDRVQQAAFGLLSQADASEIHGHIADRLLQQRKADPSAVNLFELLGHMQDARPDRGTPAQQLEFAEIGYLAAQEARRAAAHDIAQRYIDYAWSLLGPTPWVSHPALARSLQLELIDCRVADGETNAVLQHLDSLAPHFADPLDRGELDVRRMTALASDSRYQEALDSGLAGLQRLGYGLWFRNPLWLVIHAVMTLVVLRRHGPETLPYLPWMKDRRIGLIVELLAGLSEPAYHVDQAIYALMAVRAPRLTVRHGLSKMSSQSVGGFGMALVQLNDYAGAARLSAASRKILELNANAAYRSAIEWCSVLWVDFMQLPVEEIVQRSNQAHEIGLLTGDPVFALWSAAFASGLLLPVSLRRSAEAGDTYRRYVDSKTAKAQLLTYREVERLTHLLTGQIDRAKYDSATFLEEVQAEKSAGGAHAVVLRTIAYWLWTDYAQCWRTVRHAHVDVLRTSVEYLVPYYVLYGCLAYCEGRANKAPQSFGERRMFSKMRGKARALARYGERHFAGLDLLIDAQWSAALGRPSRATALFEAAVRRLESSPFVMLRATAHECAGRFFARLARPKLARRRAARRSPPGKGLRRPQGGGGCLDPSAPRRSGRPSRAKRRRQDHRLLYDYGAREAGPRLGRARWP